MTFGTASSRSLTSKFVQNKALDGQVVSPVSPIRKTYSSCSCACYIESKPLLETRGRSSCSPSLGLSE